MILREKMVGENLHDCVVNLSLSVYRKQLRLRYIGCYRYMAKILNIGSVSMSAERSEFRWYHG